MKRLKEKGFPKGLVTEAFNKVKNLSQEQLLNKMETNRDDNKKPWNKKSINQSINFTKNWFILQKDPVLKELLPSIPMVTFRRAPTIKNIMAPSRLRRHARKSNEETQQTKGSYKCGSGCCLCCGEKAHVRKDLVSFCTKEKFGIKHHLNCQSQYVVYFLVCVCGIQYVGRTTQRLQPLINKHRANIRHGFLTHSVSRHMFMHHRSVENPYKVTSIDFISP